MIQEPDSNPPTWWTAAEKSGWATSASPCPCFDVARRVFEYSIDRQRVPARKSSRAHAAIETRHIPSSNMMTILRNKGAFLMVDSRIHAANCIATRRPDRRCSVGSTMPDAGRRPPCDDPRPGGRRKTAPKRATGAHGACSVCRMFRAAQKAHTGGSPGVGLQTATMPASHGGAQPSPRPARATRAGPCPRWKRWGRRPLPP